MPVKQHPAAPATTEKPAPTPGHPGDIPATEFRAAMHRVADMVADLLEGIEQYPVVPRIQPGDVRRRLPADPPATPESLDRILADYKSIIEPNTTHWNHPGFMAYFSVTGSGPGILGETLAAALNVNAMLWRTGPAPTELEEHVCDWLRQWMGLPPTFKGHINDTASIGSLLAIAAARQRAAPDIRRHGMAGRADLPRLTLYASEQAHSSIDKAAITLGFGLDGLRKIPTDSQFRMDVGALERTIAADRAAGCRPCGIIATVGTTSTTSIDPVLSIAKIAQREQLWLHVDGAYAGVAAICPEWRPLMAGLELADSIVTNPHKWMFVPVDCSVLLVRDTATLKEAFSVIPDYLKTTESGVTNLMDYGVQLGRRFRALKMWMVYRRFGLQGLQERMRNQHRLARELAGWIEADPRFEICAPVPFTTICFRGRTEGTPAEQDAFNQALLDRVNAAGPVLLSQTRLNDRLVVRLTVGNLRTTAAHLAQCWRLIQEAYDYARDRAKM